jgi:pyrimidine-specific ribonucleoside hydrolase
MSNIPLILNVDTGIDDAFAIALAVSSEFIDLKLITTSFGNCPVKTSTTNTLRILELLGRGDIPVAVGASGSIMSYLQTVVGSAAHGDDGLGNKAALLPYPEIVPSTMTAVEHMAKTIKESKNNVIIISTCALTNVAVLLLSYPEVAKKIDGIAFSGGSLFSGNVLPTVEANVFSDPEAAQVVLNSGIRVLMCSLEASIGAYFTFEDRQRIRLLETRPSYFLCEALKHHADHFENLLLREGSVLHDIVPVAWTIDPSTVETKPYYIEVDLDGRYTRGSTVADFPKQQRANAAVCMKVDRKKLVDLVVEGLGKIG